MRSATRFYTSEAIRSAYFSPALAEAGEWEYLRKEGVRVLVAYGTKEVFEDEDKSLIEGMKIDGVDVQAYIVSNFTISFELRIKLIDRIWMGIMLEYLYRTRLG